MQSDYVRALASSDPATASGAVFIDCAASIERLAAAIEALARPAPDSVALVALALACAAGKAVDQNAGEPYYDYLARAAIAAIGVDGDVGWQPIETAPRGEMILSCADGMVRLVMWEAGCWVQIGATIEKGIIYLTPDFISGSSLLIERQSGLETRS